MVELEFHCCMCGEENKQNFDVIFSEKDIQNTGCNFCGEEITVTIVSEYKIMKVDQYQ